MIIETHAYKLHGGPPRVSYENKKYWVKQGETLVLKGEGLIEVKALLECLKQGVKLCLRTRKGEAYLAPPDYRACSTIALLKASTLGLLDLAKKFIKACAVNRLAVLKILDNRLAEEYRSLLFTKMPQIESAVTRNTLMLLEAELAQKYYEALKKILPPEYEFEYRTRRPPRDYFSAALGYASTILYKICSSAIQTAGLDPRLGILHEPRSTRPSLVLDLAEEFRPIVVESPVIALCLNKRLDPSKHYTRQENRIYLNSVGRTIVSKTVYRKLSLQVEGTTLLEKVYIQAEKLRQAIVENKPYQPYTVTT